MQALNLPDVEDETPLMMSMRAFSPNSNLSEENNENDIALLSLDDESEPIAENISGSVDFNSQETKTITIDGVNYTVTNNSDNQVSFYYSKNADTGAITFTCSEFTIKGESDKEHNFIINGKNNKIYGANLNDTFDTTDSLPYMP